MATEKGISNHEAKALDKLSLCCFVDPREDDQTIQTDLSKARSCLMKVQMLQAYILSIFP